LNVKKWDLATHTWRQPTRWRHCRGHKRPTHI